MSVCIINLIDLDPASNGGLSRVAKEFSRAIFALSVEYPALHPVFAVQASFAPQFERWLQRPTVVIPVNPDILVSALIGLALRGLVRLRNLGRFWRSSSIIARELMWQQAKLAREIEEKFIE